mmetsp:Transcript_12308/g.18054  ORF Transcript_12308/g.18054 Transcript_12308/m.18054 type:complete len:255 (-) Transcript_12308:104-868(-)|eukprot:CAMPEP_0194219774 /NCGR_PEP_ID=MMETSP0156-20130528/26821_1 /TAXON_ID=33649 /ORGANISM="Thalassionema nitzschioides, Strain L26-B" /LENGTH=254 /DNA_ID=CAMNT_0038949567 /DNA_START=187 /DNA_END=951 /DNA_ORIENTATION=-
MATPSICGNFISSKKSLLAFTWSITTLLTFIAFLMAIAMVIQIDSHYRYLERTNVSDDDSYYSNNNRNVQEEDEEQHSGDEEEREQNWYHLLAGTSSGAMTFVALYTMVLAIVLSVYGSTAIVGFTNIQGVYIAPCFPHRNKLKIGIFGGAVVVFANLLLLNAVIFGEFRVEDYREAEEREEMEPYAVERIATVLAVTCMFLSALYAIFAILLFLSYASDNPTQNHGEGDDSHSKPLTSDHRHQQFIQITDINR